MKRQTDAVFMRFADAYLREAYPNPTRSGCPGNQELQRLAECPLEADLAVVEHISCCSPCYSYYAKSLRGQRRQPFVTHEWYALQPVRQLLIGTLLLLTSVSILRYFLPRSSEPRDAVLTIDLRGASQVRGAEHESSKPVLRLPRRPLELALQLPIGSEEGAYRISLQNWEKDTLWSQMGEAHLVEHVMTVNTRINLTSFSPGKYEIIVETVGGTKFEYPIELREFS